MVIETGFLRGCQWAHQDLKQHLALRVKRGPNSNLSDWKPQLQNMNHPCTHRAEIWRVIPWPPQRAGSLQLYQILPCMHCWARCAFTIASFKAPEAPKSPPFFSFSFFIQFLNISDVLLLKQKFGQLWLFHKFLCSFLYSLDCFFFFFCELFQHLDEKSDDSCMSLLAFVNPH